MTPQLIIQTFTVPISLRFVEGQVDFWRKNGFDVHFLTADGPEVAQFVAKNNANHTIIPFNRSFSLVNAIRCLWLLVRYFLKHKPAIVHGNTPKAALLTMIAAWLTKIPVRIYEMHGLPLQTASSTQYLFLWFIEKLTCMLATSVMAVSTSLREVAIQKKVVCLPKIATVAVMVLMPKKYLIHR
jgi:Glycosyl transferase 4-like domain